MSEMFDRWCADAWVNSAGVFEIFGDDFLIGLRGREREILRGVVGLLLRGFLGWQ